LNVLYAYRLAGRGLVRQSIKPTHAAQLAQAKHVSSELARSPDVADAEEPGVAVYRCVADRLTYLKIPILCDVTRTETIGT
jgi:hypothetical protein